MSSQQTTYTVRLARNPETFAFSYETEAAARAAIAHARWADAELFEVTEVLEPGEGFALFGDEPQMDVAARTERKLSA